MALCHTDKEMVYLRLKLITSKNLTLLTIFIVQHGTTRGKKKTTLTSPANNRIYMVIFSSLLRDANWFSPPAGNFLVDTCFSAALPLSKEQTKSHATNFKMSRCISPGSWNEIFEGLKIPLDKLVLDLSPGLGIFICSVIFSIIVWPFCCFDCH